MEPINRRAFIRTGLGAAAGALVGAGGIGRLACAAEPETPRPCVPTAWKKHGVVLEPTEAWEGNFIQNFTTPAEPLDGGRWRIWYSASGGRDNYSLAFAEGPVGGPMKKTPAECSPGGPKDSAFSIGGLPEKWRPVQVVHIRLKNGRHRIYFWVHGPQVVRYLAAESDDGRRYRVVNANRPVLYHPSDRAAWGVPSPDGVMAHKAPNKDRPADEPVAPSLLISNDATNVYQLPDGTFELYSVGIVQVPKGDPAYMPHDNAPGWLRMIDRYTSADGLRFETRKRIIQRDAKDPADQQFYYLSVTHTPKGRVGMLGHYRCQAQTMDIEWCFSADGDKWNRPERHAWLPRGKKGEPDSYGVYSGHGLVQRDKQWYLFYTGVNSAHNHKESYGKPRSVILCATTDSIWA